MRAENVLVITIDDGGTAPDALGALTGLAAEGAVELRAVAVIHRSAGGRVFVSDPTGNVDTARTLADRHPRLATLLTVLTGPLDTLLFGSSLVALTGAPAQPSPGEVVKHLARAIPPGQTAVVADVAESTPAVLDQPLSGLGTQIAWRPLVDVEAELKAAGGAREAAGAEARRVLRGTRGAGVNADIRCRTGGFRTVVGT